MVRSTFHKSYEKNEHAGKRKVDTYRKTIIIYRLEIIHMYGFLDIFVVENINLQKKKKKKKKQFVRLLTWKRNLNRSSSS